MLYELPTVQHSDVFLTYRDLICWQMHLLTKDDDEKVMYSLMGAGTIVKTEY